MADPLQKSTLFDPALVKDLISKVRGKSALAQLCGSEPRKFNGEKEFTFAMDDEVDLVAEGGASSRGSVVVAPVVMVPFRIEYGARISEDFMYASEEEGIEILKAFNDGFAKKAARGLDLMAFHGINPRTNKIATLIGTNYFDNLVTQTVENAENVDADQKMEAAIGLVQGNEEDVTGAAMSGDMRAALAALRDTTGKRIYDELKWGGAPVTMNGLTAAFNSTVGKVIKDVSDNDVTTDLAIVGNFQDFFKWGYSKNISMEIIPYGDPDNTGRDLKGHHEIYLKCEAYIGWGILLPRAFARILAQPVALGTLTVASTAGSSSGKTAITVTETKGTGNIYKYKVGTAAQTVELNQDVSGWITWDGTADITAATGKILTLVEATAAGAARKAGTVTVTAAE